MTAGLNLLVWSTMVIILSLWTRYSSASSNTRFGATVVTWNHIFKLDRGIQLKNFGDILRPTQRDAGFNDPALTSVTREFGPSVIKVNLPFRSEVAISDVKPWSSWWFPKKETLLFDSGPGRFSSAFDKYDLIQKSRSKNPNRTKYRGSAAAFERKSYKADSLSWEGLCDAWSIAAVTMPEPKKPVQFKTSDGFEVKFSISELKGLLLKTYEAIDEKGLKYFGQKFTGDLDGWIQPDMYPEQFHRMIEKSLFEDKQAFVMDHDAGIQVWNVPVYKANYVMEAIADQPNSILVRMWVYSAAPSNANEKDFIGTKQIVREYNYVLSGNRNGANELVVESGYWVKTPGGVDSRRDHPDYVVWIPPGEKIGRKSWNPELDIELVDEILAKSY